MFLATKNAVYVSATLGIFAVLSKCIYVGVSSPTTYIYIYETCETSETIAVFNDLALGFKDITLF